MMEFLQKQLSDKVHIKHLRWMEPFAKIVNSNIYNETFLQNS